MYGGGPQKAPNTPSRGVGGNSSMSGILSTPEAVPTVAPAAVPRAGKAGLAGSKSQIDLSDSAAPPVSPFQRALSPDGKPNLQARLGAAAAGLLTKSTVSMSSDLDTTPLRTGKGMHQTKQQRENTSVISIGGVAADRQAEAAAAKAQSRPRTASNQSSFSIGQIPAVPQSAPSSRPQTARRAFNTGSTDIFSLADPADMPSARLRGRAHVQPTKRPVGPEDGLPNQSRGAGSSAGRKHTHSNIAMFGTPAARPLEPSAIAAYNDAQAASASSRPAPPPNSNGSGIPMLKLPGSGGIPSVPRDVVAGAATSANGEAALTRRGGNGNARNASSLFEDGSALSSYQPARPTPQIPDVPAKFANKQAQLDNQKKLEMKGILQSEQPAGYVPIRAGKSQNSTSKNGSSVQGLLGWQA